MYIYILHINECFLKWWRPSNHPKLGNFNLETHGDFGIPHDFPLPYPDSSGCMAVAPSQSARSGSALQAAEFPVRFNGGQHSDGNCDLKNDDRLKANGNTPQTQTEYIAVPEMRIRTYWGDLGCYSCQPAGTNHDTTKSQKSIIEIDP